MSLSIHETFISFQSKKLILTWYESEYHIKMPCMICADDHLSHKCPELSSSLYGKMGEGGKRGHSHEEDSLVTKAKSDLEIQKKVKVFIEPKYML